MAFTDEQLQKIDNAIASPVEEEHFGERGRRLRSPEQLIAARKFAAEQRAVTAGVRRGIIRLHGEGV